MKNNIIKKVLAVILSVISIADILSLGGYAINNDRLDLSQYTMEDLCSMSSKEFRDLLTQFEKEYDPFGTYSEYSIMSSINDQADFNWSSGKYDNETGELLESGSHELITSYACSILANDKGFFSNNAGTNFAIALSISLASLLPDRLAEEKKKRI